MAKQYMFMKYPKVMIGAHLDIGYPINPSTHQTITETGVEFRVYMCNKIEF
jgi:hypothetical protein